VNLNALRNALANNLGHTLTPDVAAAIERNLFPGNSSATRATLEKWRHLIEPVISQSVTPLTWDLVLGTPVSVVESQNSVIVFQSGRVWTVWVAAGDMQEVLSLFEAMQLEAKSLGVKQITYLGRAGWVRAAGFTEKAVFGVKEL
jgi:hypothetical protein